VSISCCPSTAEPGAVAPRIDVARNAQNSGPMYETMSLRAATQLAIQC
jgi:hypothetical protein